MYKVWKISFVGFLTVISIAIKAQVAADTFFVQHYPVPEIYYTDSAPVLPDKVLNHKLPYFPQEIYNQWDMPNCGQASGLYNCLTYEFNRLLNRSADSTNTFSPMHVFNFLNGGDAYFGVSTFDSWNVVKSQGCPVIADFIETEYDYEHETYRGVRWMNGYEKYYNGMKNRISEYYALDAKDGEDLEILRHYFNDHLDGSDTGGTAIFYSYPSCEFYQSNACDMLSPILDSAICFPYNRRPVCCDISGDPTHSMTIVGYYNNISVDFNNDSLITNDIDINSDGIVDYHDNEKILWVGVNSHGDNPNSVFLLKYDAITQVWNKQVFFPVPDTTYEPKITLKIKLKHPTRNAIKISAGISGDMDSEIPEKTIDFPVFNFQGSSHYISGIDSLADSLSLEIGIDASDLLSQINHSGLAKLFVIIDNASQFSGLIQYLSIIDYTQTQAHEYVIVNQDEELPKINTTSYYATIGVEAEAENSILLIDDVSKFTQQTGVEADYTLPVSGGEPPYVFSIVNRPEYVQEISSEYTYNEDDYPGLMYDYLRVHVSSGWPFKFGGECFDSLYITNSGVISFTDKPYIFKQRYPYDYIPEQVFDDAQIVVHSGKRRVLNRMTYYVTDTSVKAWMQGYGGFYYKALVEIFKDGKIRISYDSLGSDYYRTAGLCTFNKNYFSQLKPVISSDSFYTVTYFPVLNDSLFTIDSLGNLHMHAVNSPGMYEVYVSVRDANGQKASKRIEVEVIEDEKLVRKFYPNPFVDQSVIELTTFNSGVAELEVVSISGQLLWQKSVHIKPGTNAINISASEMGIKSGIYVCKISYNGQTEVIKFAVMQ